MDMEAALRAAHNKLQEDAKAERADDRSKARDRAARTEARKEQVAKIEAERSARYRAIRDEYLSSNLGKLEGLARKIAPLLAEFIAEHGEMDGARVTLHLSKTEWSGAHSIIADSGPKKRCVLHRANIADIVKHEAERAAKVAAGSASEGGSDAR